MASPANRSMNPSRTKRRSIQLKPLGTVRTRAGSMGSFLNVMLFPFSSRLSRAERSEDQPASAATFHLAGSLSRRRDDPEDQEGDRGFLKEDHAFGKGRACGD